MTNTLAIQLLADYLVLKFQNDGIPLTPLKLQKLLYYIQAWHSVFFDKHPLFNEEPEAWSNGPVYRSVYDKYKNSWLKNDPIMYTENQNESLLQSLDNSYKSLNLQPEQLEYLDSVINKYGPISSEKLVFMTHSENPWNEARDGFGPFEKCNNKISIESMFSYYDNRRKK